MSKQYYRIDLRTIPPQYADTALVSVTMRSPVLLRREVERFARYMRREFNYDLPLFDADEQTTYCAHLFGDMQHKVWVGACCFRMQYFGDLGVHWARMEWVWMHPYFRDRGILQSHWRTLRSKHHDFAVSGPVSKAMKSFLMKNNSDSAWLPIHMGEALTDEVLMTMKTKLMSRK
jgi:hypothetical protein